jgi:uncharacterized protein YaiI (UPF0178 family)
LQIFVDADACPVKDEVMRVAERHGLTVPFVSNSWMRLPDSPLVQRIAVESGADAADDWIAERVEAADIVITNDIPLARRCVEKGATVLRPTGTVLDHNSIGMAVAVRDLTTHLRDTGTMTGGPASFTKADRSRFLDKLEQAVQASKRRLPPAG